ncbi:MAG: methionyl-tRNA formyltransferase [Parvibaculaceae bacterium]
MGTPDFAVPTLAALIQAGHEIVAVYSQPPRPQGRRGLAERPSPIHEYALQRGLYCTSPASLREPAAQMAFASLRADAAVIVAYGLILPKPILSAPAHGCFNVHASLLPRWRGAAPIQRAIMAGDSETGVTIMRMEEGLDTGPMCQSEKVLLNAATTAGSLHDYLAQIGAKLMVETLSQLEQGTLRCRRQPDEGVTYAKKIDKAEAHIDFNRPADRVRNHIHGLSPFPGAWFGIDQDGRELRIKILACESIEAKGTPGEIIGDDLVIACAEGAIRCLRVQREGRAAMTASELLRGLSIPRGTFTC